ncbi:flagellar assembly protein FliW, partial [bacterium]|nr:flagellar assembly protein FliW [bacterium]
PNNNPRGTTVNLLAPIVFNITNHNAGQVILSGSGLSVTQPLFENQPQKTEGEPV